MADLTDFQYPIGRLTVDDLEETTTTEDRAHRMAMLAETPARFEKAIAGLSDEQLDTPYRPDGWTIRQVIHHMADSHLQAYVVFKFTLTVDQPLMRMYDTTAWGEFADARTAPVEASLKLLHAVHTRWSMLMDSMRADDFSRSFERPEWGGLITLDNMLQMFEWHQRHHLRHIAALRERMGW